MGTVISMRLNFATAPPRGAWLQVWLQRRI